MPRISISMRWWLGLAFALIAALTALSVAQVFNRRAEGALRDRGQELAIGQSVSAAAVVKQALERGNLNEAESVIAERRRFSIFVFTPGGQLVGDSVSRGVAFANVPDGRLALRQALAGHRYAASHQKGKVFVVALQVGEPVGGAIVTFTSRPELLAELGIVRGQLVRAALLAVGIAAIVGLLVAILIAARLRGIGRAAAAIESGAFDEPLVPRFRDEVGSLAITIDHMRERLRDSFGSLEAERDRLRRLLEGLQEGVVAVDDELNVAFANGSAHRLFPRLQVGRPLPEPWPDFPLRDFAGNLLRGARGTAVQARVVDSDRTYALAGIPPAVAGREAILIVADISERERRERAEREFVTNAAHELGTPVTAIATSLEVLQSGAKEVPADRDRFLELIERQTTRLTRLRHALLALARAQTRQEALKLQPVPLRPLFEQVANELATTTSVELRVDCPDRLAALAQPELVEQIVFSLVQNALKHAEPGRIELGARSAGGGRQVSLEVRDDGRGIPGEERERLFDRFYRADEGGDGFGLGLAIVREAVRALGGTIEVESTPGGGTTVRVALAAAEEVAAL